MFMHVSDPGEKGRGEVYELSHLLYTFAHTQLNSHCAQLVGNAQPSR